MSQAQGIRVNTSYYDGDLRSIAVVNPRSAPGKRLLEVRTKLWYQTLSDGVRDPSEANIRVSREELQQMLDLVDGRVVRDNLDDRNKCEPLHDAPGAIDGEHR